MTTDKHIKQEQETLELLSQLTRAYAQVAALRMKRTRVGVLSTREFMRQIAAIFDDVRVSYRAQVEKLKGDRVTFLAHNGKSVIVFLGANTGLYGEIVPRTFELFLRELKQNDAEATIVGRMGKALYLESGVAKPYTFFDLPDYGMDSEQMAALLRHVVQYESVKVFYGQYQGMTRQEPAVFEVTEAALGLDRPVPLDQERLKYYFEPELAVILQFSEGELFNGLLDQVVREGQLAKFASRMLSMDKASLTVDKQLTWLTWEKLRLTHANVNRKQSTIFAGVDLW